MGLEPISAGSFLLNFLDKYEKRAIFLFKKIKYKFFPLKFDIAFSIEFKEGLNSGNYYDALKKNFSHLIEESSLSGIIRIIDFSDIQKFKSKSEAENYIKNKEIQLLIWGDFSTDNLKINGEVLNETNFSFTYKHPIDKYHSIRNYISNEITSKFKYKKFNPRIFEKNSYNDVKIISTNLFDISIFTIALIFKFFGTFEKSTLLFERLYENLEDRDKNFKELIVPHLIHNYEVLNIIFWDNGEIEQVENFSNKILSIKPNDLNAQNNLAICYYRNNKPKDAERIVNELYKKNQNSSTAQISYAFFCIRNKNYKKAYRLYQKFFDYNPEKIKFEPLEVIEFLNNEYLNTNELGYLYGSAVLNYNYGDKKFAIRDFRRFLKKADITLYPAYDKKSKTFIRKKYLII